MVNSDDEISDQKSSEYAHIHVIEIKLIQKTFREVALLSH